MQTHYEIPWRPAYEARAAAGWTASAAGLLAVGAGSTLAAVPALALAALSAGFAVKRLAAAVRLWDTKMALSGASLISVNSADLKANIDRRTAKKMPQQVLLGRGFEWKQRHTQRLYDLSQHDLLDVLPPDWYLKLRGRPTSTHNAQFAGAPWIHGVGLDDETTLEVPLDHLEGQTAVFGTTGAGKCLRPSALVHTTTGWVRNDSLRAGDMVSTPDGGNAAVVGVYPQPEQDWFTVTLTDGRVVTAGAEHLWEVWTRKWPGGRRVVDTATLQKLLAGKGANSDGYYLRLAEPVEMPEESHAIPPYVLGVLLGDGTLTQAAVSYAKGEVSVAEAVAAELEGTPWVLSPCYPDGRSRGLNKRAPNSVRIADEIEKLGLRGTHSWTKFVPASYLAGSAAQRLALLQGLLDTDGTVIKAGSVSYVSTSRQLAQDVQELVWSLGGSATIASYDASHLTNGVRVQKRTAYRVGIRVKSPKMLFRHALKKARAPESTQYSTNFKLRIDSVEHVGRESGICIAVDHPDHLYICAEPTPTQGRQYVVTHNTRMAEVLVSQAILRGEVVIFIDPKFDQDLVDRMYQTCLECGRKGDFQFFHPGYPRQSVRIDPMANFGKVSELASRIASLLPSDGQAATFQAYAWNAINTIAAGQVAISEKPTLASIRQYLLLGVDGLLERVLARHLAEILGPEWADELRPYVDKVAKGVIKKATPTSGNEVTAYAAYYAEKMVPAGQTTDVVDSLVEAFTHGREHHGKMISSLIPLMNMLATGHLGKLLSPDALDIDDTREIIDSAKIIQSGSVVYMALDSLPDKTVAGAIGAIVLADFAAAAGAIYNYTDPSQRRVVSVFVDEAAEVVNAPFLSILNKGRGAGFRVTIFTQLLSDLVSRMGSEDAALQLLGNLNNNIALRSIDEKTQTYLTSTFGMVPIHKISRSASTATHSADLVPSVGNGSGASLSTEDVPLVDPATLGRLPNFHFFGRVSGGKIVKGRCPLFPKIPEQERFTIKLLQQTAGG